MVGARQPSNVANFQYILPRGRVLGVTEGDSFEVDPAQQGEALTKPPRAYLISLLLLGSPNDDLPIEVVILEQRPVAYSDQ